MSKKAITHLEGCVFNILRGSSKSILLPPLDVSEGYSLTSGNPIMMMAHPFTKHLEGAFSIFYCLAASQFCYLFPMSQQEIKVVDKWHLHPPIQRLESFFSLFLGLAASLFCYLFSMSQKTTSRQVVPPSSHKASWRGRFLYSSD